MKVPLQKDDMLIEATNVLVATARNSMASEDNINSAAQSFFSFVESASQEDVNAAMKSISRHFDLDDPSRGAFLAVVCGVLVERGANPMVIADPLTTQLEPLLESAGELAAACAERLPPTADENEDQTEALTAALEEVAPMMPDQNSAWIALEQFWRPAIAVFSISRSARHKARSLLVHASKISQYHEAGHWLCLMLSVLDDEPILVIEPSTSLGIVGRISGVVDNFQLNSLLMDAFPQSKPSAGRRLPQVVVDVARGIGPQETNDTVTSIWDLYAWQAVQPGLGLPDPNQFDANQFWIWNEGIPADIPVFEGYRVILLGPHSYPRSWQSQRMFERLPAELNCERTLTKEEIAGWLTRMRASA